MPRTLKSDIDSYFDPDWAWLFKNELTRAELVKKISDSPETFWSVKACALVLNVAPGTVRQWARKGKLPASRIDKAWRIRGYDLLEQMKDRWQSTNELPAKIRIGGLDSASISRKLDEARAQATRRKQNNSNTG